MIPILNYEKDNLERVYSRTQINKPEVEKTVSEIVADVKLNGDKALFEYEKKFDAVEINKDNIEVSKQEKKAAYLNVKPELLETIREAKKNIYRFHKKIMKRTKFIYGWGYKLGSVIKPVKRAGIYVPGGTACYPSSVLMCAVPALVAGVKEIVMVSPKINNPLTIVAACECGIEKIYKVGGAQAIAALAYGTESVKKVDVIAGPGNIYVATAKKQVFGSVNIDMIAGPSEILVIADSTADPALVAADMLSQAEHDVLAASILITDSEEFAKKVSKEIDIQQAALSRKDIIEKSISENGAIIVVKDIMQSVKICNKIAPEHLEIISEKQDEIFNKIRNCGAVFMGSYSSEPLGDYFAGPSHVLPTSGTAKSFSVLSADTFTKKVSYIKYSKKRLQKCKDKIINIAKTEGLTAHAEAINRRFMEDENEIN